MTASHREGTPDIGNSAYRASRNSAKPPGKLHGRGSIATTASKKWVGSEVAERGGLQNRFRKDGAGPNPAQPSNLR
jgi:hypothetical protein